jgi:predicted Zn-dependent peptidase
MRIRLLEIPMTFTPFRRPSTIPSALLPLLILGAACSAPPADTSNQEELTLENGIRVLLLPHPGSGLVASNVFVGAGSTREEDRYAGSSHFLEHVLFNGTERRTQEEIYAAADRIGAYNNATTGQEYTHYMMVAPAERLEEALDIQSDMLLHSTLPSEKFEKERGIALEELSKDKDDPDYAQQRVLDELLYGALADFARPVLGTAETISSLPRPTVVEYYARQYVPANMRLVLMGDFEREEALGLVREFFQTGADRRPDEATTSEDPMPGPAYALGSPGRMTMKDVEAPKIRVKLVAEIPEESPEEDAAFALLAQIAGGTKSGRLKRVLEREPAITHEEAEASLLYREGVRLLQLGVRLPEGTDPRESAKRLLATLHSLSKIGEEELEAARTALLAQEVSQLEQLHYYALFQGDRIWHMPQGFTPNYLAALEKTNSGSLGKSAGRLLERARLQIAAAGPGLPTGSQDLSDLEAPDEVLEWLQSSGSGAGAQVRRNRPPALEADEPPQVLYLDNGLTLVHTASASTRMFALHLLVKNRSLREPEEAHGIADLLHRSIANVSQAHGEGGPPRLDRIGAELKVADNPWIPYDNYYTTPLYSFIRLGCVDEYYQEALDLLFEMLDGPHDNAKALDDARNDMISAIQRSGSRPSDKATVRFRELLYPGHARSLLVLGNPQGLSRITPEALTGFAEEYLSPDQLVLAVVGNVPRDAALKEIESTLGKLEPVGAGAVETAPPPLTEMSITEEIEGGGNQSALRMGRVMELDPDDRWALIAATRIATSRMQQDLRETRGLAYSLGLSVAFHGDRAVITASMGTRPENVDEAVAGLRSYVTGGELDATADEIEIAVNKYLSRMRMRRVTSMGQAFTLSRDLFRYGAIDYAESEARGLASVTPEDVNRAAGKYLSKGPMITVIAR